MATDRDRSIDALLRQTRGDHASSVGPCVDAEVLAAWMDGALSGEALAAAEHHAAGCARCQALLASMATTAPEIDARPWWRTRTAYWFIPAAAVGATLVLWVAVERESPLPAAIGPARSAPAQVRSTAEPAAPLPAPETASVERKLPQIAQSDRATKSAAKDAPSSNAVASQSRGAPPELDAAQAPPRAAVVGGMVDAVQPRPQDRSESAAAAKAVAPPSPAPSAAPVAGLPVPSAQAASATRESIAPKPVAQSVAITAESPAIQTGRGAAAFGATAAEIRSPEPEFRWRLVPPATIERSTDGGTTWIAQPIQRDQALRSRTDRTSASPDSFLSAIVMIAGAAPSRNVCWIVGRGGVVLLSIDGTSWQARPFPEAADLIAVRATDAKTASVTTADGRQFQTIDGGASWTMVK